MKRTDLDKTTELARRDDWHREIVGSDIRMMLAEIRALRKVAELADDAVCEWVNQGQSRAMQVLEDSIDEYNQQFTDE